MDQYPLTMDENNLSETMFKVKWTNRGHKWMDDNKMDA